VSAAVPRAAAADGLIACASTGRPLPTQVPPTLTRSEPKAFYYAQEAYFREGWRDVLGRLGPAAEAQLQGFSFVLFKPDAIMARSVERCLAVLRDEGFMPVTAVSFRFDRHAMRELWRYELNLATMQRFDAIDLLLTISDSILVVLHDERRAEQSAAARLCALKGSSLRERRRPEHLRTRIGAGTGLLNHIHTPDEPADVVRELGVLLPRPVRCHLLDTVDCGYRSADAAAALVARAYAQVPAHDLDVAACADRVAALCAAALSGERRVSALQACDRVRAGATIDWSEIVDALDDARAPLSAGDRVVFAAAATRSDLPGIRSFLDYPLGAS